MKKSRFMAVPALLTVLAACNNTTAPDHAADAGRVRMEAGVNGMGGGYTGSGTLGTGHVSGDLNGDSTTFTRGVNGMGGG